MVACFAAGVLSSAVARADEGSGFTLETGSPDALCPALEVTREAVTRRLGSLLVDGRKGWHARYTIGHAPSGTPRDFVRLELFSPEGRVELVRDLPMEGESCRTMAEVIALVLDRYFRGLVAEAGQTELPPAAVEPQRAPSRRPPAAPPRVLLERRLALEYAVSHPVALPWVGLRGTTALGSRLELTLGLRAALASTEERVPRGASVEASAIAARSGLAWRLALPPGVGYVGPMVSVALERATTQGLASQSERTRALWSGGLESGFALPVSRSLFIQTAVSAEFRVGSGRFFIENQEVLAPPWLTLGWSLGVGFY